MSRVWAICWREFGSFFRVPLGWVAIALYLFLAGVIFAERILTPGEAASLRYLFSISAFLLLPVAPAITMRLISEELRSGSIEPLMTSPVSDAAIILGKYLGAMLFMGAMLAPTLLHAATLFMVGDPRPDPGPIIAGYVSLVLLGGLYLAVGMLFSSLTANQTLAFLGTFLFLLMALLVTSEMINIPPRLAPAVRAIAVGPKLNDFAKGVIDTGHVVFFVATSGYFLVLAYVSLQTRRWR
jgi:ABC-2 type transport system permease protein